MSHIESMNTKRILILSKFFSVGFGGVPESVLMLARYLAEHDIVTDVLSRTGFHSDVGKLANLPSQEACSSQDVTPEIYEAVIVAGAWNFRAFGIVWRARQQGIPVIYAPKGQLCRADFVRMRDMKKLVYLLLIEVWIMVLADSIIFSSSNERSECVVPNAILRNKAVLLPEPYEGRKRPVASLGDNPRLEKPMRVGFISQASPRKGLWELVTGFLDWIQAHPEIQIQLQIAGTSIKGSEVYWARVNSYVRSHPLGDRVEFIGQVSGNARDNFYSGIDILAVTSFFESFGLTVAEALWAGKPVFVGSNIGILEYIPLHEGVYVMPEVTQSSVYDALTYFICHRQKMSTAALAAAGQSILALKGTVIAKHYLNEISIHRKRCS